MATTITLTGRLADVTDRSIETITRVTAKAPAYRPGPDVDITTTQPAHVDLSGDGKISLKVVAGLGWLFLEGDGWSDSIRFVAAEGMTTLWEAVVNALPNASLVQGLLTDLQNAGVAVEEAKRRALEALQQAAADAGLVRDAGVLPKNTDLNEVTTPGLYSADFQQNWSLKNLPPEETPLGNFALEVREANGTTYQRLTSFNNGQPFAYVRATFGGEFTPWSSEVTNDPHLDERIRALGPFKGLVEKGTDLDTVKTPGHYYGLTTLGWSYGNKPVDHLGNFVLEVRQADNTTYQTLTVYNNGDPVTYQRTTSAGRFLHWKKTGGVAGWEKGTTVYFWGDSAVSGGGDGTYWQPETRLPQRTAAASGATVENRGMSGHGSAEILTAAGILEFYGKPEGGAIPASGTVKVDTQGQFFSVFDGRTFTVTWAGIPGKLVYSRSGGWEFIRSTEGTQVAVPNAKRFVFPNEYDPAATHIFLMAGNDALSTLERVAPEPTLVDHIVANYIRAVEAVPADPVRHVLIGGVKTRGNTKPGDSNHQLVQAVNDRLRAMFPGVFVDRNAWLASNGLRALGVEPTAEDQELMAAGIVPYRVMRDMTHVKPEVVAVEARELWAPALRTRGWI